MFSYSSMGMLTVSTFLSVYCGPRSMALGMHYYFVTAPH
jgi:hypothetical protein